MTLSKAEAIKKIIDIMEETEPQDRYRALLSVATMYDPDPEGDGIPVPGLKIVGDS